MHIKARPYNWPYDGQIIPEKTALVIIDMQIDFCGKGGYVERMGYDLTNAFAVIPRLQKLLAEVRSVPGMHVIHTREGHPSNLCDLPANKRWRSKQIGAEIGAPNPAGRVLTHGERGWGIIEELTPLPSETIIDKPGKGSFYGTNLHLVLQCKNISHIILTGLTTDVCVHTTMREANDRGYECLILEDCTAATDPGNHLAALKMVTMQGGVFGSVAHSESVIETLREIKSGK